MAGPTGFEPATSRMTIWRPNQAERRPRKNRFAKVNVGRRNMDRTCALCLVRAALYQLSYPPECSKLPSTCGWYQGPSGKSTALTGNDARDERERRDKRETILASSRESRPS